MAASPCRRRFQSSQEASSPGGLEQSRVIWSSVRISQWNPVIACAYNLHDLHGQCNDAQLYGELFGSSHTKIQLTASDNHLPHDMVNGVKVHPRCLGDHLTD